MADQLNIDLDPAHLAPKTPEAGFQATAAYLLTNPPLVNTPQAAGYTNALAGLGIVQQVLPGNPNPQAAAPRQQNRVSPQRGEAPVRRGSPRRDLLAPAAGANEACNNITQGWVNRAWDERALRNEEN